ncbi:MAG: PhnD/SsuA/transferrin family substrate-binding protein [Pseudomonadota bacterium]
MYDWPEVRGWTDQFWTLIRARLKALGVAAPDSLDRSTDSATLWKSPALLLSQTCGYPYAVDLQGDVRLVAAPHYDLEGAGMINGQGTYRCPLIMRSDAVRLDALPASADRPSDHGALLRDLHGLRFAVNGRGSLSGYRAFRSFGARVEDVASTVLETGEHRASLDAVAAGRADIAMVDPVCWWLYSQMEAETHDELTAIAWTQPYPILPFVTALGRDDRQVALLREALAGAVTDLQTMGPQNAEGPTGTVQHLSLPLIGLTSVDGAAYKALANL